MKRQALFSRRRFLGTSAGALGCSVGICGYTGWVEPHWWELVERPLEVQNLPEMLVGARLVHLSDLHIGLQVREDYVLRVFEGLRRLEPDFVVVTGDFISVHAGTHTQVARVLPRMPRGKRATLGVLGNHDYGPAWSDPAIAGRLAGVAQSLGIRILRNQVIDVDGLQFMGLDDLWARQFDLAAAFAALDADRASLALSHNPDSVDAPGWGDYPGWVLSGHTHGGQCKPPFLPPPLLPVENQRYTAGEFALAGGRRLYISRGVGHLLRARFNVRPEVTLFHLCRPA